MKRGYSRAYTPKSETYGRYLLDKIPATLWREVRAKAKREGTSVRALVLRLLTDWTAEDLDDLRKSYDAKQHIVGVLLRAHTNGFLDANGFEVLKALQQDVHDLETQLKPRAFRRQS